MQDMMATFLVLEIPEAKNLNKLPKEIFRKNIFDNRHTSLVKVKTTDDDNEAIIVVYVDRRSVPMNRVLFQELHDFHPNSDSGSVFHSLKMELTNLRCQKGHCAITDNSDRMITMTPIYDPSKKHKFTFLVSKKNLVEKDSLVLSIFEDYVVVKSNHQTVDVYKTDKNWPSIWARYEFEREEMWTDNMFAIVGDHFVGGFYSDRLNNHFIRKSKLQPLMLISTSKISPDTIHRGMLYSNHKDQNGIKFTNFLYDVITKTERYAFKSLVIGFAILAVIVLVFSFAVICMLS